MRTRLLLALALAPALFAQVNRVVPALATSLDANDQSWFPFLYDKTRVQQVWDGGTIANTGAVIFGLAMRRDAADKNPLAAYSIPSLILTLGHSPNGPSTMSTTFASNRSGTQTQMFSGPYNVPAQPPVGGTGPWNINWTFAQPFIYARASGHLLFEFEIPGLANQKQAYQVDAARTNANGSVTEFGTGGTFLTNETARLQSTTPGVQIVPGGSFTLFSSGLLAFYPGILFLGASRTQYLSFPLPIDMGPFNAPGNSVYVSLDATSGYVPIQQGSTWTSTAMFQVPGVPQLGGQAFYAQAAFLHAASNGLGIVTTNGAQIDLGTNFHPTQILGASDSLATTGFFIFSAAGDVGGPVMQFTGAFN